MKSVNPYLNFPGTTEEAFAFYGRIFGTEPFGAVRYRDMGGSEMGIQGAALDKIAHMAIPITKDTMLMGTDVVEGTNQSPVVPGNNFYIVIEAESAEEAHKLYDGLAAGGRKDMPLERTEWAERYGICTDKFSVQWMISFTGDVKFELPNV
jgi:PhnB protein